MTPQEREYFKQKADADKLRYLQEQRSYYDEVERIGYQFGTVRQMDGAYKIATQGMPVQ